MQYSLKHKLLAVLLLTIISVSWSQNKRNNEIYLAAETPLLLELGAEADKKTVRKPSYLTTKGILADITGQLNQVNIIKSDILRGWYFAREVNKKYGTPTTWVFYEDGKNSKWMSLNSIDEIERISDEGLCKKTAGQFVLSCLDTEESECEYVSESLCTCSFGTDWVENQGCILSEDKDEFTPITEEELSEGTYLGLPNEKKLNTPAEWVWYEEGQRSFWASPTKDLLNKN